MEGGRRAGGVAQPLLPAAVEDLERAALQVFLRPAGGVDGHDAIAVGVDEPLRPAAPVEARGAGGASWLVAASGAAAVGGAPGAVWFQLSEGYPI